MIRLALIRHGHTAWNRAGRIQGRTDIPLDDAARAHLASLRLPRAWADADLVASPLQRAIETAHIITGKSPRSEAALMEMDWGAWEGREGHLLAADHSSGFQHIETWGWDYCPPGGERPHDLRHRLSPWVRSLGTDTVAVCHIGVMRVLLAMATGWEFEGTAPFRIKRDRLYVLQCDGNMLTLDPEPQRLEARD